MKLGEMGEDRQVEMEKEGRDFLGCFCDFLGVSSLDGDYA